MSERGLIVFVKYPRAGEVKTRLGVSVGLDKAAAIYRELAECAFCAAEALHEEGVHVCIFYAPPADPSAYAAWIAQPFELFPQRGDTLGERMQHAFETLFATTIRRAVIIGTDVPDLTVPILRQAFDALDRDDIILGPSSDGGYYLLGMNAPVKNVFTGIDWSSAAVLRQTVERIASLGLSASLLETLADIDTAEDYHAFLQRRRLSQQR